MLEILSANNLNPTSKVVLSYLDLIKDKQSEVHVTQKELADRLNISSVTVSKVIKDLQERGMLSVILISFTVNKGYKYKVLGVQL